MCAVLKICGHEGKKNLNSYKLFVFPQFPEKESIIWDQL